MAPFFFYEPIITHNQMIVNKYLYDLDERITPKGSPLPSPWGRGTASAVDEGGTQNRCGENQGEFIQIKGSPERGAGSAQAETEGFRLCQRQSLCHEAEYRAYMMKPLPHRLRLSTSPFRQCHQLKDFASKRYMYTFKRKPKEPSPAGEGAARRRRMWRGHLKQVPGFVRTKRCNAVFKAKASI